MLELLSSEGRASLYNVTSLVPFTSYLVLYARAALVGGSRLFIMYYNIHSICAGTRLELISQYMEEDCMLLHTQCAQVLDAEAKRVNVRHELRGPISEALMAERQVLYCIIVHLRGADGRAALVLPRRVYL